MRKSRCCGRTARRNLNRHDMIAEIYVQRCRIGRSNIALARNSS